MHSPDDSLTLQPCLNNLWIVGHNGPRFKYCGESLPLVHDDRKDLYGIYCPQRWPNLVWESEQVINLRKEANEVTMFGRSHAFCEALIPDVSEISENDAPPSIVVVGASHDFTAWIEFPSQNDNSAGTRPSSVHSLDDEYLYSIVPYTTALKLLDEFARQLKEKWSNEIREDSSNLSQPEKLGRFATYVARDTRRRYESHLMWLSARLKKEGGVDISVAHLHKLFVEKQFNVSWEQFLEDMNKFFSQVATPTQTTVGHSMQVPPAKRENIDNFQQFTGRSNSRPSFIGT